MVCWQVVLPQSKRSRGQVLRLYIPVLLIGQSGQCLQRESACVMICLQVLLVDRQDTGSQVFCLLVSALITVERCQIVEKKGRVGMLRSVDLFAIFHRT